MLLKKLIIMLNMLLMFTVGIAAQTTIGLSGLSEETIEPGLVMDFASFTGIMALISLVVTQLSKLIPGITEKKWAKPLVSIVVGILSCLFGWILQISPVLEGLIWYMVILYGVFAGLSACGLYSILKPLIELIFPPKRE
mgnify:CR=1 FL=1|jgi:hypothetical protein